jgi:hypothetical protein
LAKFNVAQAPTGALVWYEQAWAGLGENEDVDMRLLLSGAIIASTFTLAWIVPASAYTGDEYEHLAKISMAQATQIALKTQPGTITDSELEKESGGSGLRYSFDIKDGNVTHEVGIDAQTGKILENSVEGINPD